MVKPLHPALTAVPVILAALTYGVVEWMALTRSRLVDRLPTWRRSIGHQ